MPTDPMQVVAEVALDEATPQRDGREGHAILAYVPFVLMVIVIYSTLTITPGYVRRYKLAAGEWFEPSLWAITLLVVVSMAIWVFPRAKKLSSDRRLLAATAICAFIPAFYAAPLPIEKLHVTEYAVLPFLAFPVAARWAVGQRRFWLTFTLAAAVGVLEECIQGILPNRFFNFSDIALNVAGSAIGTQLRLAMSPKESVVG